MVRQLNWRDFETLVDLIFLRGGWQRISALGGDQADVDVVLSEPITGETAWVQVKSHSTQAELNDYLGRFERDGSCDRFFFVYHTATSTLTLPADHPKLHLWPAERIASAATRAGLFDWLVDRVT
ncbi:MULTISPECIES: restriction endonuclease [Bradyrhizobium]|uniref:restriction endonuclease n=1 Tax=Bradyrhizobium elkanii TaxID=29448 RepID=UPI00068638F6|nr:restriction endonuclease [Bradyrhizobium elkanii]